MKKNRPKLWILKSALPGILAIAILLSMAKPAMGPPNPYHNAVDDPLRLQKSQVYDVYGEYSIRGTKLHKPSIRRMLNTGIEKLTQEPDPNLAWRQFIRDDDIVALKFTRFGDISMGINTQVASVLLDILYQAGFKPENFMLVGLTKLPPNAQGTIPWKYGWQNKPVEFGSDSDYIALWVDQVTAIINIPMIMDDNIIGLRGAMANVTWPLLKRPARFYISQGDPFMVEIYEIPQIKNKIRLHIANALRILYHGGPQVRQSYINEYRSLIFSTDPVALDRVALELIQRDRRENILPQNTRESIDAQYLNTAEAFGLGYFDMNYIQYNRCRVDLN